MRASAPKGFTLIELLLVVVLLGLLAALALPRLGVTGTDSKATACQQNIAILNSQIELWTARNDGQYPATDEEFVVNVLKNSDIFPTAPPACPYGAAYKYDQAKKRVVPHNHPRTASVATAEAQTTQITPP